MFRTLLTTTAIVAVMQTGAFAADNNDMSKPSPFFQEDGQYQRQVDEQGYFQMGAGQILANTLIGKSVYNSASDDAEAIGDINDIVISSNGDAEAVIIGVGGFLGLGEKDVAVDFKRVGWVDRNGERWIVVDATKEELESAPAYEPKKMDSASTETNGTMTTAEVQKPKDGTQDAADATDKDSKSMADMSDREKMQTVELSTISADDLMGATVYGENQEDVGEVTDVILNDSGSVETFVVDVGGFLGINEKRVAVDADNIDFRKTEDGELVVFTPFTQEQLEQQAAYSEENKSDNLKAPRS